MRAFKTRIFARDAKALGLADTALINAIRELQEGLVDANLGNNLFKKRIAVGNKGRRGGLRTIIVYQAAAGKLFCISIFSKKHLQNISGEDLRDLQEIGQFLLAASEKEIVAMLDSNELVEVKLE